MVRDNPRLPALIDALGRSARALPVGVEFVVVIALAFGMAIAAALEWARLGEAGSVAAMTMRSVQTIRSSELELQRYDSGSHVDIVRYHKAFYIGNLRKIRRA